jgi:deoxyribodipyrimidine photo-lyase
MPETFTPTLAAAQARIAAVQPDAYARTRNALDGAVTGLSPYLTHGFVTLTEVLAGVAARRSLDLQHKFVFELGWRAYFRHVWQHRGEGILRSLHAGPLPDDAYARELPLDIREGRTGVPVVDEAVRTLYSTGMLHNHARMWPATWCMCARCTGAQAQTGCTATCSTATSPATTSAGSGSQVPAATSRTSSMPKTSRGMRPPRGTALAR